VSDYYYYTMSKSEDSISAQIASLNINRFLPRDASAERGYEIAFVCLWRSGIMIT